MLQAIAERRDFAERLGPLLAVFSGEHVGEPRLLICLYGPPLLHVDLKYITAKTFGALGASFVLWARDAVELAASLRALNITARDRRAVVRRSHLVSFTTPRPRCARRVLRSNRRLDFFRDDVLGRCCNATPVSAARRASLKLARCARKLRRPASCAAIAQALRQSLAYVNCARGQPRQRMPGLLDSSRMSVVTRFAPSPTGELHLGSAYSAWVAWQRAREAGGTFLVRIEDIDIRRCKREFETAILADLTWLGLAWDGAVRRQSDHFAEYGQVLDRLDARGLVYPCFCTRSDIAASAGAPQGPDGPLYPGTCRHLSAQERRDRIAAGQRALPAARCGEGGG